ncbi:MAG: FAD-dependent oxidoreductase [Actinomycetota bacterium]
MTETADVVVVGAGVVGVSAAYHLAVAGAGRVVVLEREDVVGSGSTGRCAGGFRHQFSSRINIELSVASVLMITGFTQTHGLPLDVVQDGYLFLLRTEAEVADFRAAGELQRSLGVDARELTPEEARELVPGLAVGDVRAAAYCPDDGIADPAGLTQGYATVARRAGAEIRLGVRVTGIAFAGGLVTGVDTSAGSIEAPVVIDAAGPWAGALAATAGVILPLEPIPRNVVTTGAFPGVPERRTLVIDAGTSFYFHREGDGVLMGMGAPDERPSFDTTVDDRFVADRLLPTATEVFPPLVEAGITSSWCGLYEMTPDRHPIVGPSPVEGLWLANGFSGHGFQHAPVIGKILAEMIVEGKARTADVAELGLARFAEGRLATEGHVV